MSKYRVANPIKFSQKFIEYIEKENWTKHLFVCCDNVDYGRRDRHLANLFKIFLDHYLEMFLQDICPDLAETPLMIFYSDPKIHMADKLMFFMNHMRKFPSKAEIIWLLTADILLRSKYFFIKNRSGDKKEDDDAFKPRNQIFLKDYYACLLNRFIYDTEPMVIDFFSRFPDKNEEHSFIIERCKQVCNIDTIEFTQPLFPIPNDRQWQDMIQTCLQSDPPSQTYFPALLY